VKFVIVNQSSCASVDSFCSTNFNCKLLSVSDERKGSLEDKTSNSDIARAETWCKGYCCQLLYVGRHVETYNKLKKKPVMITQLRTTLQIWNEVPQKPVAKAVQNFCKDLQTCVNKAGEHIEHFI